MAQPNSGIGNVTANTGLVEMAMAYSRSRVLCAAARLGVADALGDEVRSVGFLAEKCQADADALYRLLRALASIGVTEETTPEHFRLTPFGKPLRRDVPQSAWPAVIFWADLLADELVPAYRLYSDRKAGLSGPRPENTFSVVAGCRSQFYFSRRDGYGSFRRLRSYR